MLFPFHICVMWCEGVFVQQSFTAAVDSAAKTAVAASCSTAISKTDPRQSRPLHPATAICPVRLSASRTAPGAVSTSRRTRTRAANIGTNISANGAAIASHQWCYRTAHPRCPSRRRLSSISACCISSARTRCRIRTSLSRQRWPEVWRDKVHRSWLPGYSAVGRRWLPVIRNAVLRDVTTAACCPTTDSASIVQSASGGRQLEDVRRIARVLSSAVNPADDVTSPSWVTSGVDRLVETARTSYYIWWVNWRWRQRHRFMNVWILAVDRYVMTDDEINWCIILRCAMLWKLAFIRVSSR